ncbi:transcription factor that binds to CRE motif [Amphichorda felina]
MEHSPAESFMSAPSGDFPSLFATPASSSGSPAMNPMDMMSPASVLGDDFNPSRSSLSPEDGNTPNEGEKKQKKRKSWGQVLPEPKTNLPPRKRAKTEDEKEQRRVERVLRNRRAAQSSRERKRLEVEALEQRNKELEHALKQARETNHALLEQLQRQQHSKGVVVPSVSTGSPLEHTLSSQLFESKALKPGSLDKLGSSPTVNPASLSPKPSEIEFKLEELSGPTGIPAASSDTTQRPAAMFFPSDSDFDFDTFYMSAPPDADRNVLERSIFDSPQPSSLDDDYQAGDFTDFAPFDVDDWINGDSTADLLGIEPEGFHSESQAPQEDSFQQPELGASSNGCDVRGLAVGV